MPSLGTEYCNLPDIKIAYSQTGNGPTLILLHGNSSSKGIFKKYQHVYFNNYHTFAIDSRGHGKSVSSDNEYSIKQFSDDIINFCCKTGITEAYVIGYSDGGNIALFLAKQAPTLFTRIVAISPNTLANSTKEKYIVLIKKLINIHKFLQKLGFHTKKYIMRFSLMLSDIGLSFDALKTINTKVKIIYAEDDMIDESHFIDIASSIPNCEIEKIERCTHLNILDSSKAITSMKTFLNS
jgi:pimeloyl-ACP methyl ester carboxylesterase